MANLFESLSEIFEFWIILMLLTSFTITYFSIPVIIRVARMKNLFDEPEVRSSHSNSVPTLGGVSVFSAIVISISLFAEDSYVDMGHLTAAMVILFFFGIKDDILMISPFTKFAAQVISAFIISVGSGVRIPQMYDILGFGDLPYVISILITVFVIVLIINSFNLIDGVDGLAASVAILSAVVFGAWFYLASFNSLVLLSAALAGSLIAFLRYNFSVRNKIFMGDTGSMIIGFLVSVLAIEFIILNEPVKIDSDNIINTSPVIAISVLIIPLIDTLRVFMIRILNRKSPFKPDRNHIHHRLLDLGFSHASTTTLMIAVNVLFIFLAYHFRDTGIDKFILLIVSLAFFISSIPFFILSNKEKNPVKEEKIKVVKNVFSKKNSNVRIEETQNTG